MTKYWVRGGIFTDTTFTDVEPGTEEEYGPFDTYKDAIREWTSRTFTQKLDICTHRLKIVEEW